MRICTSHIPLMFRSGRRNDRVKVANRCAEGYRQHILMLFEEDLEMLVYKREDDKTAPGKQKLEGKRKSRQDYALVKQRRR